MNQQLGIRGKNISEKNLGTNIPCDYGGHVVTWFGETYYDISYPEKVYSIPRG